MSVWVHSEYQLDDQLDGVKINAVAYANFLKEKARLIFRNITFMQDNVSHAACYTTPCLAKHGFKDEKLMTWPPSLITRSYPKS